MDKLIHMLSLNDCPAKETIPGVYFFPQRTGSFPFVCVLCFHRCLRVNSSSLVGVRLLALCAFFLSYTKQLIFVPQDSIQYTRMLTITEKASNSVRKIKTRLKKEPFF